MPRPTLETSVLFTDFRNYSGDRAIDIAWASAKTSWFMAYLLGKRKTPDRLVRGNSLPIYLGVWHLPLAFKGRSHVTSVLTTAETWVTALNALFSNIGAEGDGKRA